MTDVYSITTKFYDWWRSQTQQLPQPPTPAEMKEVGKPGNIELRSRIIEFLHTLKTDYAWSGDQCQQARLSLKVLEGAIRNTAVIRNRFGWVARGAGIATAAGAVYALMAGERDLSLAEKAAVVTAPVLLGVAAVAYWATGTALNGLIKDFHNMKNDVFWRCMPHDIYIQILDLADRKLPEVDDVNFVPLKVRERAWTAMDTGFAAHDDTPELIVGAFSGASLLTKGGMWLVKRASSIIPREFPIGMPLPSF
jgi:hypothetical protein